MERLSSLRLSHKLSTKRYSSVPCLKYLPNIDDSKESLLTPSTTNSSRFFISQYSIESNQADSLQSNTSSFSNEFSSTNQEEFDRDCLNTILNQTSVTGKNDLI